MVRMTLEQLGPRARRFRRTNAFKNLDPTEKGAVNYFLGMTICKVFAEKLLGTPWLLHLDVWGSQFNVRTLGRSRPDLVGQQSRTGHWHAFECKGRSSSPSNGDQAKAKQQAGRVRRVAGQRCRLHVASFSFYRSDVLEFYWQDPPAGDFKPIELDELPGMWRHYYQPFYAAWMHAKGQSPAELDSREYPLSGLDVWLGIHPQILELLSQGKWDLARARAEEIADELGQQGYSPDGLKLICGQTWSEPFDERAIWKLSDTDGPPDIDVDQE